LITIVNGNLLDAKEDIIGHQCNARGQMGSGVAKQLRERYPEIYEEYSELFTMGLDSYALMGYCQLVKCTDGKQIANIIGQLNYGRTKYLYTDYAALEQGLRYLKAYAKSQRYSIALPYKVGCGLANGDWDGVVFPMLEEVFSDYNLTLYRYEG
jgi:O-acetyl-ADP-ribose deacetylase (regulator of RNase III)